LFVIRSYITQDSGQKARFKADAIQLIRKNVLAFYNKTYDFFTAEFTDKTTLDAFVKTHFKALNGKIYQTSAEENVLWLALHKASSKAENDSVKELFNINNIFNLKLPFIPKSLE
jgi:hypothetical protein